MKLTQAEIAALEALAYQDPRATIKPTTMAELERKGYVSHTDHPLHYTITSAGRKALERAKQ